MANTPLNSALIFVYVTSYTGTGGVKKLAACLLDSNLDLSKNEVDASSKCGPYFLAGNDDQTFTMTLQALSVSDAGTATTANMWDSFQAEESVSFQLADDDVSPTVYDVRFSGTITGWAEDLPQEGAVSVQVTVKVNGTITRNI
jgi:hypothetical protein